MDFGDEVWLAKSKLFNRLYTLRSELKRRGSLYASYEHGHPHPTRSRLQRAKRSFYTHTRTLGLSAPLGLASMSIDDLEPLKLAWAHAAVVLLNVSVSTGLETPLRQWVYAASASTIVLASFALFIVALAREAEEVWEVEGAVVVQLAGRYEHVYREAERMEMEMEKEAHTHEAQGASVDDQHVDGRVDVAT